MTLDLDLFFVAHKIWCWRFTDYAFLINMVVSEKKVGGGDCIFRDVFDAAT